jgi:hypothetical protein
MMFSADNWRAIASRRVKTGCGALALSEAVEGEQPCSVLASASVETTKVSVRSKVSRFSWYMRNYRQFPEPD